MKKIPETEIAGANVMSPMEMNAVHIETGRHSEVTVGRRGSGQAGDKG